MNNYKIEIAIIICLIISNLSYVNTTELEQFKSQTITQEYQSLSTQLLTPTLLAQTDTDKEEAEKKDQDQDKHKHKDEDEANDDEDDDLSLLKRHGAFVGSFLSILVTEIGDKTFIVTAVLATKYNKLWVFIGSYGALFLMTLISCFIGNVSLSLINPDYIKFVAAALFFVFGFKAVYEAVTNKIEDDEEEIQHDLKELDEKIAKRAYGQDYHPEEAEAEKVEEEENKNDKEINGEQGQENEDLQQNLLKQQQKQNRINAKNAVPNTFIAAQTFTQNFLGEWGDRSQISTIAMSASFDFFKVFLGCALGHAACSYLAITGGKLLAEKFSERTLTLAGGILFIIYGIATLFSI